MSRVAIVGGGIAGLSLAHALVKCGATARGVDVAVLERSPRAGGNIRTDVVDGFTCEWGPNGFLDNAPDTLALARDVGLGPRLLPSDQRASKRFIFRHGRLHELPGGPAAFLRSGLLSWKGKARIALEPLAQSRPDGDETIHAFATRRIGREAADVLIDSMVSGVFGGDARRLSLRACFPKMWEMETEHGGLFRALLARRRRHPRRNGEAIGSPLGRLTSFTGGSEDLIRALADALGGIVRTNVQVDRVRRARDGYVLTFADGSEEHAAAVVLAGGAHASAALVRDLDESLASTLGSIPTAPMVVVCLGYVASRMPRPLDGFGFLVPRGEGPRLLGALWDSSVYPGRAPKGHALIRVMMGGAHDPAAIDLGDAKLGDLVRRELRVTMGLDLSPDFFHVFRHPVGIPQYTVGHLDRLAAIDARLSALPGLFVAGNAYRGVAINACVAEAGPLGGHVLEHVLPEAG